jgi:thioredoxin reductase (NADPH)
MANWDIAIVGGGATGLSAGAAAAKAGLSCLVIDRMGGGGELMNLGTLHDIDTDETGPDLFARLLYEATEAGAEMAIAEVTGLQQTPTGWRIETDDETHTAQSIVLATGLTPGTLGLSNETDFEGMGLSHCAACDGPLYVGQPVVVAGAGRWAAQEARELTATASHVTLITQGEPAPALENVTVVDARIVALEGTNGLNAIRLDVAPFRIETPVVFLQTGRRPARDLLPATPHPTLADAGTAETLAEAIENGRLAVGPLATAALRC